MYLPITLFNPYTFSPILSLPPPDNPPNILHTYDSVPFMVVCFDLFCSGFQLVCLSFAKSGKFSFTIFSNKFSIPCSSSSSSDTTMIQMLAHLEMSQSVLILPLFFLNSCFCFLFWLNVYFFVMFLIIDLNPGSFPSFSGDFSLFHLLYVTFISSFMFLLYCGFLSILITSVLNSASDRLDISVWFFFWGSVL